MQEKTVLLEKNKGIGIVTLNRPDELNAMDVIQKRESRYLRGVKDFKEWI